MDVDNVIMRNRCFKSPGKGKGKLVISRCLHREITNLYTVFPLRLVEGNIELPVPVDVRCIDGYLLPPPGQLTAELKTCLRRSSVARSKTGYNMKDSHTLSWGR